MMPSFCGTRRLGRFSKTINTVIVLGNAVNRVTDADLGNVLVQRSMRSAGTTCGMLEQAKRSNLATCWYESPS